MSSSPTPPAHLSNLQQLNSVMSIQIQTWCRQYSSSQATTQSWSPHPCTHASGCHRNPAQHTNHHFLNPSHPASYCGPKLWMLSWSTTNVHSSSHHQPIQNTTPAQQPSPTWDIKSNQIEQNPATPCHQSKIIQNSRRFLPAGTNYRWCPPWCKSGFLPNIITQQPFWLQSPHTLPPRCSVELSSPAQQAS